MGSNTQRGKGTVLKKVVLSVLAFAMFFQTVATPTILASASEPEFVHQELVDEWLENLESELEEILNSEEQPPLATEAMEDGEEATAPPTEAATTPEAGENNHENEAATSPEADTDVEANPMTEEDEEEEEEENPDLQAIFDANAILLNEMTTEMHQLLAQIQHLDLPPIEILPGFNISVTTLLDGFMNGLNILGLINIGGIGRLNNLLFHNSFTYLRLGLTSTNLVFPNGILNGSNPTGNTGILPQSLEAQIAAQEYLLYVTDAVRGAFRLFAIMDMDMDNFDMSEISDVLAGARSFLEFNMDDLNQRRDRMYSLFTNETGALGGLLGGTRNVSAVVRSVDGGGYDLLMNLRNDMLGDQENVDTLIDFIDFIDRILSGELLDKYNHVDFTDIHAGIDQILTYLIADVTEVRDLLERFDRLAGPLADLLDGNAEGGVVGMILSFLGDDLNAGLGAMVDEIIEANVPGHFGLGLADIMHDLLGGIDFDNLSTQDVIAYLDNTILALEGMRSGARNIDLEAGIRFVTDLMSGALIDRYLALRDATGPRMGTILRLVQEDVDGAIAVLEMADLLDRELAHVLGGRSVVDLIREYLLTTLPHVINHELDGIVTGLGGACIGEVITAMLSPAIRHFSIPRTIRHLRLTSRSLSLIIPIYERLENTLGDDLRVIEDGVVNIVRDVISDTVSFVRDTVFGDLGSSETATGLQNLRGSVDRVANRINTTPSLPTLSRPTLSQLSSRIVNTVSNLPVISRVQSLFRR